jgi:hypothetical protein
VGVLVDEQIVSYKKMFLKEHFENMVFKLFLLHSLFFEGLKELMRDATFGVRFIMTKSVSLGNVVLRAVSEEPKHISKSSLLKELLWSAERFPAD